MANALTTHASDAAILARLIRPEDESLSDDAARSLLRIRFEQADLDRMHELALRHQSDQLSDAERAEMDSYRRVGLLIDLMHSRARRTLKKHGAER